MDDNKKFDLKYEIGVAFTPSAPINQSALFAGRKKQIELATNAIFQRGQHAVIYGERGVGKTSLSNIIGDLLSDVLTKHNYRIVRFNCAANVKYSDIWHGVFRELSIAQRVVGFQDSGAEQQARADELLTEQVQPEEVRFLLERIGYPTIIIIDEVDRIQDRPTTTLLADTVKTLSDHSVRSTLMLVGVADSVDEIIAEHRSVERALVQVPMPRMSPTELHEIVDKGLAQAGITIDQNAKEQIAVLSQGLPHYTHSLTLHAGHAAVDAGRTDITVADLTSAMKTAVETAQASITSAYEKATRSPKKNLYKEVLLSCALAKTDRSGHFFAAAVRQPMSEIMGRAYDIPAFSQHLKAFCDLSRGPILQKSGQARIYQFRFINPLMEPFVTMKGLAEGLIPPGLMTGLIAADGA